MTGSDDPSEPFGPLDLGALRHVRSVLDDAEPLVESTGFDDPVDPRLLQVRLADGFEADGRFDVRFSDRGYYSLHYTEPGLDARFDYHPNPHSPEKHFHPPPDAATPAEPSCIRVVRPELVALAVVECWRTALDRGDPLALNAAEDPP